MSAILTEACKEWHTRPEEDRYESITQMKEVAYVDMAYAKEQCHSRTADIKVQAADEKLILHTPNNTYDLNNWTMSQLCSLSKAPKSYIATLSTDLASKCLNESIANNQDSRSSGYMFMSSGKDFNRDILRSITSPRYERIFDYDILSYIEGMQVDGWTPPPPKETTDGPVPTGMFRSDRSMFAFMINDKVRIDDGTDDGLSRGFFVGNSEVGGGSFFIKTFLYRHICGNHMVLGCSEIKEVRMKHIGKHLKNNALNALARDLTLYANGSVLDVESKIANAKLKNIGKDSESVIDFLFKNVGITRVNACKAWDKCLEEEANLDPTSVWGMVQGITAVAREEVFTDIRVDIEKSAEKLMELV